MSVLNDPNLFANGADVTTKDILKRYGDIANRPPPKQHMIVNSPPRSREGRPPSTPVFHRVDSDLTQSTAWQRESSARPSGGPTVPPQAHTNPPPPLGTHPALRGHSREDSGSSQDLLDTMNGHLQEQGVLQDQQQKPLPPQPQQPQEHNQNGNGHHNGAQEEQYRAWTPRQPSQTHQPIGAG